MHDLAFDIDGLYVVLVTVSVHAVPVMLAFVQHK